MFSRKSSARNSLICGLLAIATFIGIGLAASAQTAPGPSEVDFAGFMDLSDDVFEYREARLLTLADFNQMASDPETIILDARSRYAFEMGHIAGAVNLPFSDFTDDKLAEIIPNNDARILIYCNNNFSDNAAPVMLKKAPLALNIPTFINLVGYGYDNVYELSELVSLDDPRLTWVSAPPNQFNP